MNQIWVLGGGPSTEHEVSLSSACVVTQHIASLKRPARPVVIGRDGRWHVSEKIAEGKPEDAAWLIAFFDKHATAPPESTCLDPGSALTRMITDSIDCAFIALHGQFGEDGCIQGFLQAGGIPYTGSGVLASALAFHKGLTIAAYLRAGLRTARSMRACSPDEADTIARQLNFPLFVKPNQGGSSVGIRLVTDHTQLRDAISQTLTIDNEALVEELITGTEVSAGVLDIVGEDGELKTVALPPTEIRPTNSPYFDYDAKYLPGRTQEITPANLPPALLARIQGDAVAAHRVLGCEGMSRTDFIIPAGDDAIPVLLETNTIPGMTPTSLLPQQAAAAGISFAEMLNGFVEHAIYRARRGGGPAPA